METTNPTMKKLLRLTNSSQAKKSFEVAIELGTREKQLNNLFRKFWKLKRQYRFVNALETGTVYVSILTLIGIQLQNM